MNEQREAEKRHLASLQRIREAISKEFIESHVTVPGNERLKSVVNAEIELLFQRGAA